MEWFAAKKPDLRVLVAAPASAVSVLDLRPLAGGFAVQERDARPWDDLCPEVVTTRQPTDTEWADLRFAWGLVKHARSNAVVLARGGVTVGLGAGAVSRIWAAERAVANAGERAVGAVLASEAFFPFDDVVRLAAGAGVLEHPATRRRKTGPRSHRGGQRTGPEHGIYRIAPLQTLRAV